MERGRGAEHETERARRPALLADDVAEIVAVDLQLETRLRADFEDLDADVVGVIDEAASDQRDDVAETLVLAVRLAPDRSVRQLGARGAVPTGTDDSLSPARRKRVIHRANDSAAGSGWLSLRTTRPLAQRATPLSHTRSTVVV